MFIYNLIHMAVCRKVIYLNIIFKTHRIIAVSIAKNTPTLKQHPIFSTTNLA